MDTLSDDATVDTRIYLFRALADELKRPFLHVARTAETADLVDPSRDLRNIDITAQNALTLIDNYLLVTSMNRQVALPLKPVSLTATMYDVAQHLYELSKLYESRIDIQVQGSFGHVIAHPEALKAGLTSLAYTFLTGGQRNSQQTITLQAKSTRAGISAGVLSNNAPIISEDLHSAMYLHGKAKQPASAITQNSGVGLYIAESLFSSMETTLKVIKSGRRTGIAATLLPSQQLVLL